VLGALRENLVIEVNLQGAKPFQGLDRTISGNRIRTDIQGLIRPNFTSDLPPPSLDKYRLT